MKGSAETRRNKTGATRPGWRCFPLVLVGCAGLICSGLLFGGTRAWETRREQTGFLRMAEDGVSDLERDIDWHLGDLHALGAFYAASENVGRTEFHAFVSPLIAHRYDIQAMEWIPRVRADQRAAVEQAARDDGLANLQITERDEMGQPRPAGPREVYFPVFYVEPLAGNEAALGYDLGSNPARLEALNHACDADEMTASARIKLVQETERQFGVLVFFPVYKTGARTDSVEARRANLEGFGLAVFRMGDLLDRALSQAGRPGIDFHLFDGTASTDERFLASCLSPPPTTQAPSRLEEDELCAGFHYEKQLDVAGRKWLVVATPTQEMARAWNTWLPWVVLCAALAIVSLLMGYLLLMQRDLARATAFAEEEARSKRAMKHEIAERTLVESILREREAELQTITDTALNAILMMDAGGCISFYNRAAERMFGWTAEEAIGKNLHGLLAPDRYGTAWEKGAELFRQSGEGPAVGKTTEFTALRKDGTEFPVEIALASVKLGGTWHAVGIVRDITERKRMEEALRRSEEQYKCLFEQSSDAIFVADPETRMLTDCNEQAERITGYSRAELLSLLADQLHPDDVLESTMAHFRSCREGQRPSNVESAVLTKARRRVPVLINASNVDIAGKFCVMGTFRDITERKRMEEELRFRNVLLSTQQEVAIDGILVVDENGKILSFNRRFVDMWGVPAEVIESRSDERTLNSVLDNLVEPGRFIEKVRYLYDHRNETSRDEIALTHDRTFDRYSAPMLGEAGKYYGRVWYFRDMTERKQMLEALQRSEELYRTLFRSSHDAIMTLDPPSWRFTSGNPACKAMFGAKDEEKFASHRLGELSPERQPGGRLSAEQAKEMAETAMREGSCFFDWRAKRLGGEEFPATILLTRFEIGHHAFLQATVRDVSRQKQMEMELNQALKLEAVGRLAAGIAHEINTPAQYVGDNIEFLQIAYDSLVELAGAVPSVIAAGREGPIPPPLLSRVNGLVEHANLGYLTEQVPRAIEQSIEGIGRIITIVQAMKDFSQPGVVEKTPVDLNQCIRGTATVSRGEWKCVADLELDLDDALPQVLCLPGDFNQAILNLIVNAAHAIADVVHPKAAGGSAEIKGKITISTRQDGAWAEVRIEDTGAGIPEEIRERIFDPFFTTKEVGRGTGQGLAIARNVIVDKHGGTISVESEVGKGSTFIIRLPIENVDSTGGPLPEVRVAPTEKAGIQ